ncbi:coiled-coil domain-containing protein 28A-like [Sycon ciliatum]|uniref:coiled-coil domain-containing protein 28A-like n=1 Tax=Sycon ciliatum TaxID=27933 RepID=UPI0020A83E0C|eukprot:scpid44843/ scgid25574/ 
MATNQPTTISASTAGTTWTTAQLGSNSVSSSSRSSFEHTPLPAVTNMRDTKQIEHGLQRLRDEFRSGKLEAFGGESRQAMDRVCQMQQQLAWQHLELDRQLDHSQAGSLKYAEASSKGLDHLMTRLTDLGSAVQTLREQPSMSSRSGSPAKSQGSGQSEQTATLV